MTIAEKILARASGKSTVSPHDYVTAKIDMAMMPEMFRLLPGLLAQAGIQEDVFRIWDPEKFVVVRARSPGATILSCHCGES